MQILRNLKLGTKVSIGFSVIVLLLVITVLFSYFELSGVSQDFFHYRKIARDNMLAEEIKSYLFESRIAFKSYLQSGKDSAHEAFQSSFSQMERSIAELKKEISDTEREYKIEEISQYAQEYKQGFNKNVYYEGERYNIMPNLLTLGEAMEQQITHIIEELYKARNYNQVHYAESVRRHLLLTRLSIVKYLEENNDKALERVLEEFDSLNEVLVYLDTNLNDSLNKQVLENLKRNKENYHNGFLNAVSLNEERNKLIEYMDKIGPKITQLTKEIKDSILAEQNTYAPKVERSIKISLLIMIGILAFSIIASIIISVAIKQTVITPVKAVANTFKEISEGETHFRTRLETSSNDELGEMAKYFNIFVGKLQQIITQNINQSWFKTGQAEINELMKRDKDIYYLCSNVIGYLTKYLDGVVGTIYVKQGDEIYKLLGSYAYNNRKTAPNQFKPGEGIIGQVVIEKQIVVISNVPQDYINVTSGTGEAVPRFLAVVPCVLEDNVKCILEIGFFNEVNDIKLDFLKQVSESIAFSFASLEANIKLKELLDKTTRQTEKLQVQQEELRQSNEELEEQAAALRESQEKLQAQQEELRITNEELEEQAKSMEKQKNDIKVKNEKLLKAREELEEKAKALEVANRYKSEFLANMSHELRTPLNSILVLSQLLADKADNEPLTEKQKEFAKTIHSSGSDLLRLINEVLDLSKMEAGKMGINKEKIDVRQFLDKVEKSFKAIAAGKNIEFIIDINNEVPEFCNTDPQRLQQIINNLLANAFKFTEAGSVRLTVDIQNSTKTDNNENGKIRMIRFLVTDTGIGISPEKHKLIFEAFTQSDGTTSRRYGGSGLGLSISKQLAQLLGGDILLESEIGRGSTFCLALPLDQEAILSDKQVAAAADITAEAEQFMEENYTSSYRNDTTKLNKKNKKSLLIIEDDKAFSNIIYELAVDKGFEVFVAANGQEGIDKAIINTPSAIILDLGLPDIDGLLVLDKLKAHPATVNIPVHIISGNENIKPENLKNSILSYFKKPINIENIETLLKQFANVSYKRFGKVLVVDRDKNQIKSIREQLGGINTTIVDTDTGEEALEYIKNDNFDAIILELNLKDMSGLDLLAGIGCRNNTPIIVYTEKDLTYDEELELQKYAESIVIKGTSSMERLIAEVSLFLHGFNTKSSEHKLRVVKTGTEREDALRGRKMLIVDDDMRNVFAMTSALEEKGIKVIIGRDGREGIQKLKQNPDTELVIMDIMMPEMDGYTAMKEIRNMPRYSKLPVIALTAKAMKEDRQKCIEAGASDYLTKPIDVDKLISLLRVWLYK